MDLEASKKKVKALTEPRNAVLVGANDRPGSWAWRVLRNLKQYEFPQPLYLVNPRRTEIGGDRCYPDFKSLPEPPDHLVVLVPAPGVPEVLRSGAAAGARSATVFSSGFGEAYNSDAAPLGRELKAVIAETGLAVSGPNCMGNICAKTRLVTLSEDRPLLLRQGPIALVGQSGGMMIFLNAALEERGMNAEYLITSGNEAGLGIPDYIAFFSDQPELKVIIVYIEAIADIEKFKAACRMARAAGKAIVAVKLGQSESGRNAAMAHTASLAGSIEAFDAVAADFGDRARRYAGRRRRDQPSCWSIPARRAAGASAPSRCRARSAGCFTTPPSATVCNFQNSPMRRSRSSMPFSASARWSQIRSTAASAC